MNTAISNLIQRSTPVNVKTMQEAMQKWPQETLERESYASYELSQYDTHATPRLEGETRWAAGVIRSVAEHAQSTRHLDNTGSQDVDYRMHCVRSPHKRFTTDKPDYELVPQENGVGYFRYARTTGTGGLEAYESRTVYDEKGQPEFHLFHAETRREASTLNSGTNETVVVAADGSGAWYLSQD